jgi:site-specific DNA recombinase
MVERTVFEGLKANLTTPNLITAYVETYNEERKRLSVGLIANRSRIEKRLARVKREFDRMFQSYVKGFSEEVEVREPPAELRAERKRLEVDLASAEKPPETVALHPTALARYRQQVEDFQKALSSESLGDDREPVRALRELVAAIVVLPTPPGAPIEVEVRGRLAALIGHQVFPAARMWGGKVVAEDRYSYSHQRSRPSFLYDFKAPLPAGSWRMPPHSLTESESRGPPPLRINYAVRFSHQQGALG